MQRNALASDLGAERLAYALVRVELMLETDWIRWLPLALLPLFLFLMYWPVTSTFFDLTPLDWRRWAVVVAWSWLGRFVTLGLRLCH